ncbi:DUF6792 domain-containing protein [Metabacillus kandeliae]|uniref:DUF6792 domain-containing protein n=1 Tax=Metabacillus kandeliae TaxID=2900151 RepID=UPI002F90BC9C
MSGNSVLNSDILRARIAKIEYDIPKNATKEQLAVFKQKIKQVIVEETGKEPPAEIEIYSSGAPKYQTDKDSGFDGTIIHFYDPNKGINQSYTITRGSEMGEDSGKGQPLDWLYNTFGIYAGKNTSQLDDATVFFKSVEADISARVEKDLEKRTAKGEKISNLKLENYGIGHSLGGNLIQMLSILSDDFKEVYTFNDAPPSVYQLFTEDKKFQLKLMQQFNIKSLNQIYSLPPEELKKFAEDYYKEKGAHIHHVTNEEEILYGISGLRGFLFLGDRKLLDSNPNFAGLKGMMSHLSDKDLAIIQKKLAELAPAYEKGGIDGLIYEATGYDKKFWDDAMDSLKSLHPSFNPIETGREAAKGIATVIEMGKNAGLMLKKMYQLKEELPALLHIVGAVSSEDREKVIQTVDGMIKHLENIENAVKGISGASFIKELGNGDPGSILKLLFTVGSLEYEFSEFMDGFDDIKKIIEEFKEKFDMATAAHLLDAVIGALSEGSSISYEGDDMVMTGSANGQTIKINLSSAVRIYKEGIASFERKESILKDLQIAYQREYPDDYQDRKRILMAKIADMEANHSEQEAKLNQFSTLSGTFYRVTRIEVQENIYPLPPANEETFSNMFQYFEKERTEGIALVKKIRSSIEAFFKDDQKVAAIFKYS